MTKSDQVSLCDCDFVPFLSVMNYCRASYEIVTRSHGIVRGTTNDVAIHIIIVTLSDWTRFLWQYVVVYRVKADCA